MLPSCKGMDWGCGKATVTLFSAYLVHNTDTTNRLLISLFMKVINSLHIYTYLAELLAYMLLLFNHNLGLHCTQMTAILKRNARGS